MSPAPGWEFAGRTDIGCVRRGLATRDDGTPASLELCAVGRRMEEPLWDFFQLVDR